LITQGYYKVKTRFLLLIIEEQAGSHDEKDHVESSNAHINLSAGCKPADGLICAWLLSTLAKKAVFFYTMCIIVHYVSCLKVFRKFNIQGRGVTAYKPSIHYLPTLLSIMEVTLL